jgi:hypothetical protein
MPQLLQQENPESQKQSLVDFCIDNHPLQVLKWCGVAVPDDSKTTGDGDQVEKILELVPDLANKVIIEEEAKKAKKKELDMATPRLLQQYKDRGLFVLFHSPCEDYKWWKFPIKSICQTKCCMLIEGDAFDFAFTKLYYPLQVTAKHRSKLISTLPAAPVGKCTTDIISIHDILQTWLLQPSLVCNFLLV